MAEEPLSWASKRGKIWVLRRRIKSRPSWSWERLHSTEAACSHWSSSSPFIGAKAARNGSTSRTRTRKPTMAGSTELLSKHSPAPSFDVVKFAKSISALLFTLEGGGDDGDDPLFDRSVSNTRSIPFSAIISWRRSSSPSALRFTKVSYAFTATESTSSAVHCTMSFNTPWAQSRRRPFSDPLTPTKNSAAISLNCGCLTPCSKAIATTSST
mmetsp:Transcript_45406/g.91613  ORF Transcript_45406/g.91613 Transcript_45406/m.91613 type:complete len:212 (-) Transcript_45406:72-707(-)